jgi:hypothetical protein
MVIVATDPDGHRPDWGGALQHLDFRTIQVCPKDG